MAGGEGIDHGEQALDDPLRQAALGARGSRSARRAAVGKRIISPNVQSTTVAPPRLWQSRQSYGDDTCLLGRSLLAGTIHK
jgi:hypothetical protein